MPSSPSQDQLPNQEAQQLLNQEAQEENFVDARSEDESVGEEDLTDSQQALPKAHSVPAAGLPAVPTAEVVPTAAAVAASVVGVKEGESDGSMPEAVPVDQEKGAGGGGAAAVDLTESTEDIYVQATLGGEQLNNTETILKFFEKFVHTVTGTETPENQQEANEKLRQLRSALGEQLSNIEKVTKEAQQKYDTERKEIEANAILKRSEIAALRRQVEQFKQELAAAENRKVEAEEAATAAGQAAAAAVQRKATAEEAATAAEQAAAQRTATAEAEAAEAEQAAAAAFRKKATAEAEAEAAEQRTATAKAAATEAEINTAEAFRTKEKAEAETSKQLQETKTAASNYTALGVSAIIGIIASIYSQTLQNMLFGKIFFGKAILFGYALPMVNLAAASVMFGLVFFGLSLAVISTAKFAEDKPLFRSITQSNYFRPALSALSATITYLTLTKYAVAIQLALFGKIFLGGTILANLGFAIIPTTLIVMLAYTAVYSNNNFKQLSALYAFAAGALFASPILQALAGIAITGSTLVVIASSIAVGATAAALTFGLIYGAAKAKTRSPQAGFTLTMYAVSFVLLSIYASPIQIALFGRAMMAVTPLLSNISFGAIASVFTSAITTLLYKTTEEIVTPALMNTYETSGSFKEIAATAATSARTLLASIGEALGCTASK